MLKNFEIKLNNIQSILLIASIFAIGILCFSLGFIIGKGSSYDITALKSETQESITPSSQIEKRDDDIAKFSPPPVAEKKDIPVEKVPPKKRDESNLTFFKTLPDAKKVEEQKTANEKQNKDTSRKPAKQKPSKSLSKAASHVSKSQPSTSDLQLSYTVQVGSFRNMDEASNLKTKLEKKGYQSYIAAYDTTNSNWFRVRIGQFKTKSQAESMAKKLKTKENLASFVTTIK